MTRAHRRRGWTIAALLGGAMFLGLWIATMSWSVTAITGSGYSFNLWGGAFEVWHAPSLTSEVGRGVSAGWQVSGPGIDDRRVATRWWYEWRADRELWLLTVPLYVPCVVLVGVAVMAEVRAVVRRRRGVG